MNALDLIQLGLVFLLGLACETLGRRTRLPKVTLLLLLGLVLGPQGMALIEQSWLKHFELIAALALTMVGFLLGGKLVGLTGQGAAGLALRHSLMISVVTFVVVGVGLWLIGVPPLLASLLASVALATDPAAVLDVSREHGGQSYFGRMLLGIVALDDAWGLLIFSAVLVVLSALFLPSAEFGSLFHVLRDLGGSLLLGLALGFPLSAITGRIKKGEATTIEAIAVVLLCCGLSLYLQVSFILTAMVMGYVIARFARHHQQSFHEIEHLEWPLLLLFFIMVGASFQLNGLATLGVIGLGYVGLRVLGRWLGGLLCLGDQRLGPSSRRWLGLALLPQAGVAIGVALLAAQRFPDQRSKLLPVVMAAVVLFELVGPVITRLAMRRSQSAG
ncbi:cation:proton antiporter [Pseudomarimonas arenosa]|uniref:Cation:proton antiporter n=1 Tax=Pseudomarimonas arenosa TaxID=2774145 RepID=A0AAW3ZLL1_9GAMM|nr:cation:proton antiporter [Pseudomarimonas arenosa]MBD8525947.1 cation:proton antiporter [Pseudomarimonas arenosa]